MNNKLEIRAEVRDFGHRFSLHGMVRGEKPAKALPLTVESAEPGCFIQPFATLEHTEAQQLMDDLWRCGLRPSEGSGSAGSLRATERHLEDMRALVFKGKKP